jgi:hypothetical protein
VALLAAVTPLWVARDLPMVDLPQHLYVLSVLRHLRDPGAIFAQTFEYHVRFTPYLGYYAAVGVLHWVLPLEAANRLWLTFVVLAYPLSMAFLLVTLRRPAWPALLATPLAYGDSFAWGFVNTLAATPLAVVTLASFVRAIERPAERRRWSAWVAGTSLAGFLTHPAPVAFLALALPWTLLTTRAPDDRPRARPLDWFAPRALPIAALAPLALAIVAWLATSGTAPSTAPGGGPSALQGILSRTEWVHESLASNLGAFLWLLGAQFRDNSDQLSLLATLSLFVIAPICRFFEDVPAARPPGPERLRRAGFVGLAFTLYLALPVAIHGQIQYLSPRFAMLTAMLATTLMPLLGRRARPVFFAASTLVVLVSGVMLARGFRRFSDEASSLRRLASACADHPRVLGLIFEPHSAVVWRPVYLHAGAVLARLRAGVPSYSLAGGNQIPLRYRHDTGLAPRSEWQPERFDYVTQGVAFDHFLLRGARPDSVFGARLGTELELAGREGEWSLVRRKASHASADTSHSESAARVTPTPAVQPSGR